MYNIYYFLLNPVFLLLFIGIYLNSFTLIFLISSENSLLLNLLLVLGDNRYCIYSLIFSSVSVFNLSSNSCLVLFAPCSHFISPFLFMYGVQNNYIMIMYEVQGLIWQFCRKQSALLEVMCIWKKVF